MRGHKMGNFVDGTEPPNRKSKARKFILVCEHELWLETIGHLNPGQELYCVKCGEYRAVGPAEAASATTVEIDGWISKPGGHGYIGECIWTDDCHHTETNRNWYYLRDMMYRHVMRTHVRSRFAPAVVIVTEPLPKNASPPF